VDEPDPGTGGSQGSLLGGDRRLILPLLASSSAIFVIQLDLRGVQTAIPRMADDLGVSSTDLHWVLNGTLLAAASLLVIGGRLGDIFGRRRFLTIGSVVNGHVEVPTGGHEESPPPKG